ncbi:MAG: hypothetical protein IJW47_00390, partial [Clostridia bacterium]|nr:hypothetical protein [Clostridia bacterium]
MYYYFSGDYGVAIKINGIFYGTVTDTVKTLRIDGEFNPLIEILPLSENAPPVNFILDDAFLLNPPERICVTDLKGGYLIKFNHIFSSGEFKIIEQQKYPDAVATVFNENGLKISIETPNDFLADTIRFDADGANIERINVCANNFIAITLTGKKNLLVLYSLTGGIRKLFCREVDKYSVQDGLLVTTENFSDIAKHTVKSFWEFTDGELKRNRTDTVKNQNFDINLLPEKLIPYAF